MATVQEEPGSNPVQEFDWFRAYFDSVPAGFGQFRTWSVCCLGADYTGASNSAAGRRVGSSSSSSSSSSPPSRALFLARRIVTSPAELPWILR
ncbi:hypothetical protein NL676_013263 [Syzygium grande]|nr:hypothetical protein NL676_013263 [Syzygium grande]